MGTLKSMFLHTCTLYLLIFTYTEPNFGVGSFTREKNKHSNSCYSVCFFLSVSIASKSKRVVVLITSFRQKQWSRQYFGHKIDVILRFQTTATKAIFLSHFFFVSLCFAFFLHKPHKMTSHVWNKKTWLSYWYRKTKNPCFILLLHLSCSFLCVCCVWMNQINLWTLEWQPLIPLLTAIDHINSFYGIKYGSYSSPSPPLLDLGGCKIYKRWGNQCP